MVSEMTRRREETWRSEADEKDKTATAETGKFRGHHAEAVGHRTTGRGCRIGERHIN